MGEQEPNSPQSLSATVGRGKTMDYNPMEHTNEFMKTKVKNRIEEELNSGDLEETAMKPLLSPTIMHQKQNQTHTTNKFSNFGFFAGSPRTTTLVDVHRNIDICEEDQIEVSIEEAIDGNIAQIDKERVKALTRQKSKNTQSKMNHPQMLLPKKTTSPEVKKRGSRFANEYAGKKVSQYGNDDLNSHDETAMVDHLRVSSVKEVVEDQKYVEITMAN